MTAPDARPVADDVETLKAVIDSQVYCTVVLRPAHADGCRGNCSEYGCPVPVQDYGDTGDLAATILASDWFRDRIAAAKHHCGCTWCCQSTDPAKRGDSHKGCR